MRGRVTAWVAAAVLLSACGASVNPSAVVATAAQKLDSAKSFKFDFNGHVKLHTDFGAGSFGLGTLVPSDQDEALTGTGEALLPGRLSMDMHVSVGDTSSRTHFIADDGAIYVTIPTTGRWVKMSGGSFNSGSLGGTGSGFGQIDPTGSGKLLKYAKSVVDLGDTELGDARVHHYRLLIDPDKVKEALSAAASSSPGAGSNAAALAREVTVKEYRIEVWIGAVDNVVRRTLTDFSMSVGLPGPTPASRSPHPAPAVGSFSVVAHVQVDYHDFGAKVTIIPPAGAQDLGAFAGGSAVGSSVGHVTVIKPSPSR